MPQEPSEIKNKKAFFNYHILDTFIAGIVLTGTEIKSIRNGKVSLQDAYCYFKNNELYVKNLYIAEYEQGNIYNHDPLRERKLLLQKHELKKIQRKLKDEGITVIVLKLFINSKGWAKLEIALAKGKKQYDKREDIRKKDMERAMKRNE